MAILSREEGNSTVVTVGGRLDAVTGPQYQQIVQGLIANGVTRFVVDLAELSYISSAGIGELLVSSNVVKAAKGQFALANVSAQVLSVLDMCGIRSMLDIHDSVAGALTAIA